MQSATESLLNPQGLLPYVGNMINDTQNQQQIHTQYVFQHQNQPETFLQGL